MVPAAEGGGGGGGDGRGGGGGGGGVEKTRRASAAEPADTRTKPSITYVHTMADLAAKSRLIAPSRFYVEVLGHPSGPLARGFSGRSALSAGGAGLASPSAPRHGRRRLVPHEGRRDGERARGEAPDLHDRVLELVLKGAEPSTLGPA